MRGLAQIRSWLRWITARERLETEIDNELGFHIETYANDLMQRGVPKEEAVRRARIEFGAIASHKDAMRASVGVRLWDEITTDVRCALRMMRRNPGFTAVTVLSVALAIGANTAIFSLVYSLMLRSLPVRDPAELVELMHRYPGEPRTDGFSSQAYQLMRDRSDVFSGLTAAAYQRMDIRGEGMAPQSVQGAYVDEDFFTVLGVQPALGRLLSAGDARSAEASAVAVVSWAYWKRFNLDPAIIGSRIIVDDMPVTVVGVTARKFSGLRLEAGDDLWLPLSLAPANIRTSGQGALSLVGRLQPGISRERARAELAPLYQSTLEEQAKASNNPFLRRMNLEVAPAGAGLSRLREQWGQPLLALLMIVGLLLLVACTSLAVMLLARAAAREHEMALRVSLGASLFRLVRQALTESLVLAIAGGTLGLVLAYVGARVLVRIMASGRRIPGLPPHFEVPFHMDWRVLLFTTVLSLLTGVLFGLIPAVRAAKAAPAPSLNRSGQAGNTRRSRVVGWGLVVTQVALSVVLLSAAGLFVRHLSYLEHLSLGFARDHVLLVTLDPTNSGYQGESLARAYQQLLERLQEIPGVRAASLCAVSPIQGPGANRAITVEGYEPPPGEIRNVMENWVGPKYFETLGTPLIAGRDFSVHDQRQPPLAIINRAMARRFFGSSDSIGRVVTFDGDSRSYHIVGVVANAKYMEISEASLPTIYFDAFQESWVPSQFALRTDVDPASLSPEVERTVQDLLQNVPITRSTTLNAQVDASIVPERLIALISGWFGALGALLAGIGLYGLLAYAVAQRTNEIGIRMALGATRTNVLRMILRDALVLVCTGLVIGIPIAFWGKRLAAILIQKLPDTDILSIIFGAVAMSVVALLAAYVPAQRAARIDPLEALRRE